MLAVWMLHDPSCLGPSCDAFLRRKTGTVESASRSSWLFHWSRYAGPPYACYPSRLLRLAALCLASRRRPELGQPTGRFIVVSALLPLSAASRITAGVGNRLRGRAGFWFSSSFYLMLPLPGKGPERELGAGKSIGGQNTDRHWGRYLIRTDRERLTGQRRM